MVHGLCVYCNKLTELYTIMEQQAHMALGRSLPPRDRYYIDEWKKDNVFLCTHCNHYNDYAPVSERQVKLSKIIPPHISKQESDASGTALYCPCCRRYAHDIRQASSSKQCPARMLFFFLKEETTSLSSDQKIRFYSRQSLLPLIYLTKDVPMISEERYKYISSWYLENFPQHPHDGSQYLCLHCGTTDTWLNIITHIVDEHILDFSSYR